MEKSTYGNDSEGNNNGNITPHGNNTNYNIPYGNNNEGNNQVPL